MTGERQDRLQRLDKIKKAGLNPYPSRTERSHTCEEAIFLFDKLLKKNKPISLVGRIRSVRMHGGSCFAHLEDGTGRIQIYFKKEEVGEREYKQFKDFIDLGDFIRVRGTLFTTKRGEKTLLVKAFDILAKTLLPLPEKWHGLKDVEIRYRKRYLDLLSNPRVKAIAKKRSLIIKNLREFLDGEGFLEVETPILQSIYGGATAKPFTTFHHALDSNFYLRIAPELYLKRLIVGGFEKIYEIGKNFRNEGIDREHNPEFTELEFYWAWANYHDLMDLTEKMFQFLLETLFKKNTIEYRQQKIKFKAPFKRLTFRNALIEYAKIDIEKVKSLADLKKTAKLLGIKVETGWGRGKILDELYKEKVRPEIIQPTFLIDHPIELSPLAKQKSDNPNYVERGQLLAGGTELTNFYSELNDPIEQRKRFEAQQKLKKAGDEEAHPIDEDFIEALEHGMPPTAGFGLGVDRLIVLLTDSPNLKEVILFPTLRQEK